jgi:Fe-S-cluster containining protein
MTERKVDPPPTGCAMCGACCNPVRLPRPKHLQFQGDDESLTFSMKHWRELPMNGEPYVRYRCDMYDSETRECKAHEDRPPVCSGFPWYGKKVRTSMATHAPVDEGPGGAKLHCSFMADVPPEWRPPDAHPLIPITPVEKL